MEIATIRRDLNHTLTELGRAIDKLAVARVADLYALAWQQAAQAPPSITRQQRAQLAQYKEILSSRRWQEEERRRAADSSAVQESREGPRVVRRPPPMAEPAPARPAVVWSSDKVPQQSTPSSPRPRQRPKSSESPSSPAAAVSPKSPRAPEPALLDSGALWELATQLRSFLQQVAQAGATTTWPAIRKRLTGVPRLHRDDESVALWMVDEERHDDEPCSRPS